MTKTNSSLHPTKTDAEKEADNELVISYLTLRNLIGICGMLLPVVLPLLTPRAQVDKVMEHSISEYYYTSNGDILVVLLSVIGVFLLSYKGYREVWERILTIIAAVCGIGIAFFPTATKIGNSLSIHRVNKKVPQIFGLQWHFIFAGLFFIALAIISLHYFPKSRDKSSLRTVGGRRTKKAKRNIVFKTCGWIMIGSVVLTILYMAVRPSSLENVPVIFILETVAVEAFGISWLTKGETFFPDGQHYLERTIKKLKEKL